MIKKEKKSQDEGCSNSFNRPNGIVFCTAGTGLDKAEGYGLKQEGKWFQGKYQ